jgi:hypothetical protein
MFSPVVQYLGVAFLANTVTCTPRDWWEDKPPIVCLGTWDGIADNEVHRLCAVTILIRHLVSSNMRLQLRSWVENAVCTNDKATLATWDRQRNCNCNCNDKTTRATLRSLAEHSNPPAPASSLLDPTTQEESQHIPSCCSKHERKVRTYVLIDTSINPVPPINGRVPRVRHVRSGVEAPPRALLGTNDPPAAKEGPDDVWAALVSRGVLLHGSVRFHRKLGWH